jgi:predicted amidophosphoribosyltransferase
MVDRTNAIEYVTLIVGQHRPRIAEFFGAEPSDITLVPVPSSEVTKTTIESARFPTLRLCHALAGVGLGRVRVLAVQRRPVAAKTTGNRRTPDEILEGLVRTSETVPRRGVLVLVDDNVQRGASLAALDKLLGAAGAVAAFAVGITDSRPRANAYTPRRFDVEYEPGASPLTVTLTAR